MPLVVQESLPRWLWCCLFAVLPLLLVLICRVFPLLLVIALMPPPAVAAAVTPSAAGGSRVRETKKALLGRGGRGSRSTSAAAVVTKGTVSKITEKFQMRPAAPPAPAVCSRIPKPSQQPSAAKTATRQAVTGKPPPTPPPPQQQQQSVAVETTRKNGPPPPLPLLPPPVVKYDIKRRQERLLGELHRQHKRRGQYEAFYKLNSASSSSSSLADSAALSDCSSSDCSEKSVRFTAAVAAVADEDKPGSPNSSGYESVEEAIVAAAATDFATAVPYSWVFGDFVAASSTSSPSSSSSSSLCDGANDDATVSEDCSRSERLVTFTASPSFCPALTRSKPDQDSRDGGGRSANTAAAGRRHFAGNDAATHAIAASAGGHLSPIPECWSTGPNSVETVEDCAADDKV